MINSVGKLLSIILKNIDTGITVQNMQGEIVYANEAAAKLIGYSSIDELMDTPTKELMNHFTLFDRSGRRFSHKRLPGRRALQGKKTKPITLQYQIKDEIERRWTVISAAPVTNTKGEIEYVVNSFRDITKQKKDEENTNHFIATASHELKTPLASIKALNQITEKNFRLKRYEKATQAFKKIDDKVNELTKIINDFLDSTKIRVGTLDFNPEIFSFDEYVDEIISDMKTLFITHTIEKQGTVKKTVVADRLRLQQVLVNLLRNARKYSPQSDKIVVHVSSTKNHVKVSVQDFGPGIPSQDKKQIFEPFYRGGKQYTGNVGGLGLGLYISNHIMQMHGGKMGVKSKLGKGSTFYFNLPLRPKRNVVAQQF